jgi:HD superfamily phosphodiesterase
MSIVYDTCVQEFAAVSRGRGPSHDLSHVIAVRELAHELAREEQLEVNGDMLDAVTITHDYSDYKYDPDGKLEIKHQEMLTRLFSPEQVDLLFKTIKYASYSTERKLREAQIGKRGGKVIDISTVDWREPSEEYLQFRSLVLYEKIDWISHLPSKYIVLRNLLSDADKLEALGASGVYRCMQYGLEYWENRGVHLEAKALIDHVLMHDTEKLSILYPHYLSTGAALKRAQVLMVEHNAELDRLQEEKNTVTVNELKRRMGM